jgi:hypothetical protein
MRILSVLGRTPIDRGSSRYRAAGVGSGTNCPVATPHTWAEPVEVSRQVPADLRGFD